MKFVLIRTSINTLKLKKTIDQIYKLVIFNAESFIQYILSHYLKSLYPLHHPIYNNSIYPLYVTNSL